MAGGWFRSYKNGSQCQEWAQQVPEEPGCRLRWHQAWERPAHSEEGAHGAESSGARGILAPGSPRRPGSPLVGTAGGQPAAGTIPGGQPWHSHRPGSRTGLRSTRLTGPSDAVSGGWSSGASGRGQEEAGRPARPCPLHKGSVAGDAWGVSVLLSGLLRDVRMAEWPPVTCARGPGHSHRHWDSGVPEPGGGYRVDDL